MGTPMNVMILSGTLLFAAVLLIVLGTSAYFGFREEVSRRLAGRSVGSGGSGGARDAIVLEDDTFRGMARFVTPQDAQTLSEIRRRLFRAGYRRPSAVRMFYALRAIFAFGLALVFALLSPFLASQFPTPILIALVLLATFLGFLLPSLWVARQTQHRSQTAEHGFPDSLDMLLVCIEAGHGIDQAIRRLARELKVSNPVLATEFSLVSDELRAGKDRTQVLRDFSDRLGVSDIKAFVTVLRQSDEFGVSIADALRVYASEMRNKRIMRAEEAANRMPLKLALGSMLFTVPPIFIILAGPSLVMMFRWFVGING